MYEGLVEILEKSVVKNGTKPLSNVWLLNILKASQRGTTKNTNWHEKDETARNILTTEDTDGHGNFLDRIYRINEIKREKVKRLK